jgi:hypothetical protein
MVAFGRRGISAARVLTIGLTLLAAGAATLHPGCILLGELPFSAARLMQ